MNASRGAGIVTDGFGLQRQAFNNESQFIHTYMFAHAHI